MRAGFVISIIFALLVSIFAVQNSQYVLVKLFFAKINISLAVVIFGAVFIGAVIIGLMGFKKEFALRKENKRLNKKIDDMTAENNSLKIQVENLSRNNKPNKDIEATEEMKEAAVDKNYNPIH